MFDDDMEKKIMLEVFSKDTIRAIYHDKTIDKEGTKKCLQKDEFW